MARPLDFLTAYTKKQQQANRAKDRQKRQAPTARDIRNYRLIQIGALWQMNFPVSKEINPYNKKELAGLARVFSILGSDPQFAWIERLITESLNDNQDRE